MLKSEPITLKVLGQNYCVVCESEPVEYAEDICETCRSLGWKWEDVSTDRGIQKILTI